MTNDETYEITVELTAEQAQWIVGYLGSSSANERSIKAYETFKLAVKRALPRPDIDAKDVDDWDTCHLCGAQLQGDNVWIDGRLALQEIRCTGCQAEWTEVYQAKRRMMHP